VIVEVLLEETMISSLTHSHHSSMLRDYELRGS